MEEEICSVRKKQRDLRVDTLKIADREPVREVAVVTPLDILKKNMGKNIFRVSYRIWNDGFMGAKDFENLIYFNDRVIGQQKGLGLGPNESRVIHAEVPMDIKDGVLVVRLDALSRIQEDDETNNDTSTMVLFKGFQNGTPQDPFLHIELLRIAKKAAQQGRIMLTNREMVDEKKGRVAFMVEYVIRNYGMKPAIGFDNLFLLDGKRFFRQPNLTLNPGESKIMELPVYFPLVNGKLTLRADANMKYPEGAGCNRAIDVQLFFQGFNS